MKTKSIPEKYVTLPVFREAMSTVKSEFHRLDNKIDNVALEVVKINDRLERVENTMATKDDIRTIVDQMDHLFRQYRGFDQEERVQSHQLQEVRRQVDDHEKRITVLETNR